MKNVPEMFGCLVFNDEVMRERLPEDIYKSLRRTINRGTGLDLNVANAVANAMKDWAVEHGATHYTHWFQPLTGITAEKHDSFLTPTEDGKVIMEFSGKALIKGESDASSFPSGGLRATFEARGYTAWDPTSFAFIKNDSLYIPTVFCSYGGEMLDKKTPLLRSMEAINEQALRVVRLFGDTMTKRVNTTVGPEQEYFLIDRNYYEARKDLMITGRTLFGAKPPKGQELEDHYFGSIKTRVAAYMSDLDEELWKLGIYSKTKHNEAAPAQHELAPVFTTTNVANDHNQLTMDIMRKVAEKHGLVCLLHEKPFAGVNGSGKHNNWSLATDKGQNLLDPGKTPRENAQFLLFLVAVIKAVDEYQDLLRISSASAGNDHRLGAAEAPPAIVSMFVGDELGAIINSIEQGIDYKDEGKQTMEIGVHVLPSFPKDTSDRNRTSPIAFTGNKFEFRMLGASQSVSDPNVVLNTTVAEALRQFADELESAEDFTKTLNSLIRRTIKKHKKILFDGDGYSKQWQKEAQDRGLLNYSNTVEAVPHFTDEKNIKLFTSHRVFSEKEMYSRTEILLETYSKTIKIEALTLNDIVKKDILPAISTYTTMLAQAISAKKEIARDIDVTMEKGDLKELSDKQGKIYKLSAKLDERLLNVPKADAKAVAEYYRDEIFSVMQEIRVYIDACEEKVSSKVWPLPTYSDIIFRI